MSEIFTISDTHFRHKRILEFAERPFDTLEEMEETIVELWNNAVRMRDTVIHIGDVSFGGLGYDIFNRLNGIIRLVMGNHDNGQMSKLREANIRSVHGCYFKHQMLFTHMPVILDTTHREYAYNVHGHLHGKDQKINDWRYFNANMDHQGRYDPIPLEEIRTEFKRRKMSWMYHEMGV